MTDPQAQADAIIDAWEEAEGESMRDGHRATMRDLIAAALVPQVSGDAEAMAREMADALYRELEALPCGDKDHDDRWCPTCSSLETGYERACEMFASRLAPILARLREAEAKATQREIAAVFGFGEGHSPHCPLTHEETGARIVCLYCRLSAAEGRVEALTAEKERIATEAGNTVATMNAARQEAERQQEAAQAASRVKGEVILEQKAELEETERQLAETQEAFEEQNRNLSASILARGDLERQLVVLREALKKTAATVCHNCRDHAERPTLPARLDGRGSIGADGNAPGWGGARDGGEGMKPSWNMLAIQNEALRDALQKVTDKKAERLAEDMDYRNKDHSAWYRAVKKARRLLAGLPPSPEGRE